MHKSTGIEKSYSGPETSACISTSIATAIQRQRSVPGRYGKSYQLGNIIIRHKKGQRCVVCDLDNGDVALLAGPLTKSVSTKLAISARDTARSLYGCGNASANTGPL